MLICDPNNSAAVSDELLRGHIPLGVIGLPADDFKVRDWLRRSSNLQRQIEEQAGGLLDERDRLIQQRLWLQNELDNVGAGWMISTELPNVARRFCVNSSALPQRIARRLADVRRGRVVQPSRADRPPAEHGT